jgi:hypothetical protein
MALQSFTITIGALTDAGNNGKNYVNNQPVYIKRTNGTLASIYRDLAGTSPITQDGLSNVTNSKGQFTFFVEAGDYNAEYQSQVTPITVVGADYFNSRIDETVNQIILDLSTSRGFRVKGTFAAGFTYELPNDVGLDASSNAWIYTDVDALPFTVPAATSPSFPTYTQVTFNQASNVSYSESGNVEDALRRRAGYYTVAEAQAADLEVGQHIFLTDRELGLYKVFFGYPEVANGIDIVDIGNGFAAVYNGWQDDLYLPHIGLKTGTGTDQSSFIQRALDVFETVSFPKGTINTRPIQIPSRRHLKFHKNTKVYATSGYDWFECVFNMDNVNNITMDLNGAEIYMLRSEYPLQEVINGQLINSEYRHCIKVYGSTLITINNPKCFDAGGDGITIGGNDPCYNVVVNEPYTNNCRRQGISVTNGVGIWVNSPRFYNTNGLPPEAGIDIEPNPVPNYVNQGIYVNDVYSQNNAGGAVLIAMGLEAGYTTPVSVAVSGITSVGDGKNGGGALRCIGGIESTAKVGGRITVRDMVASSPKSSGVYIGRWNDNSPHLYLSNIQINNPGAEPSVDTASYKSGVAVRNEAGETVGNTYGNFEIDGLEVWDNTNLSGVSRAYAPVYLNNANNANEQFADINIKNFRFYRAAPNWGSGSKTPLIMSTSEISNSDLDFSNVKVPTGSTTTSLSSLGCVQSVTANSTINLRSASEVRGLIYRFSLDAAATLQIQPTGSDVISGYSGNTGIRATEQGAYIELQANDSGTGWVAKSGNINMWVGY